MEDTLKTSISFKLSLQIFYLRLLLVPSPVSHAATIHNSLPGYPGNLPFNLETGYVGIGEAEQVKLFYYFVESERDPEHDPLLLWVSGGPGCSSATGLFYENGPLIFNYSTVNQQIPRLELNPYSWTKVASIIFIDSPVGTGFSYATTSKGYITDDITASRECYEFMRKWLIDHVKFRKSPIYISGDSYSGMVVPVIVKEILDGNKMGIEPILNLKGYILGNPLTVTRALKSSRYEFARRASLLSDELYETARISCNGIFDDADAGNTKCKKDLQALSQNIKPLFICHVLEPKCNASSSQRTWCRDDNYLAVINWANNVRVQEALHIPKGIKPYWDRCNYSMPYTKNIQSSFDYHQSLTKEFIQALIYSGDQDMAVPYVDTLDWIRKLNVSITNEWRPWFVKGQVTGYTTKYSNNHYHLTFATVKGGGHTAEYTLQACFDMVTKWFRMSSL